MATLDDRLKDDDYRHWVKAVLCLQYTKDGLVSLASNKSQDLHNAVLAQMRQSGNPSTNGICSTARIDFRRRALTCCGNCNAFLVETKKHCTGTLNLSNIDITHLHDQPWQLAKLFMNPGQDVTNSIPGQTDLSGILNFFDHCTLAKAAILNTANIKAVRDTRNRILHTADMKITKQEFLANIIPTLTALLQDAWFLSQDPVAKDSVVKLNEVAAAGFHITKENEVKIFKDLTTEMRYFNKDLNTKLDNLQTELNRVKTTVGQEMKTEQEKLKQELQDREKQTRQDLSTKVDDLQTDLKTQQDKLEQDLQDREKDKLKLEKLVQTLEQKVEYDTELVTTLGTEFNNLLEETRQGNDKLQSRLKLVEGACKRKHEEVAADIKDFGTKFTKPETVSITEEDKAKLQQYLKDGYDSNKLDVPVLATCHGLPISEIFAPVILTANTAPSGEEQESGNPGDSITHEPFVTEDRRPSAPRQGTRESEKLRSYKAMFFKENVLQKKLFLLGKAGAGKSTFCKHLCDIWCNDKVSPQFDDAGVLEQFRYLFNVSCRFAEASESIFDMICNQLFCENDEMIKVASHVLKNTPDECLVVVDGVDEWKGSAREATGRRGDIPCLPSRRRLEGCVVLSTSRPERIHMLPVKLDDTCSVLELHGIENAEELIYSILEKVEYPNPRQSCSEFMSQIRQSNMADLIQFPLMLINALDIWDRNETLSSSMSLNYSNMVEGLFLRAKDANRIEEYEQTREKENFAELPDCFIDTDLCKQNAGLIIKLGQLAFDLLFSDNQSLTLVFSGQQRRKYLTEIELKTSLAVGLLSKAQTISRSRRKIDSFSFCHKTFQEFLGALWLSTEQSKIMSRLLRQFSSTDTLLYNAVFIQFLCGLSPSTGGKFWQYIADEVIEKDKEIVNMRLKGIVYRPFYSFRYKILMLQGLVLRCIKEARSSDREQHQQLYYFFPDVYIDKNTDKSPDITLIYGMMEKFVTDIKFVALTYNIPSKIVKLMKQMKSAIAISLQGDGFRSILHFMDKKTMPELCSDSQEVPVLQFPHQLKILIIRRVAMTTSEVEFPSHLTTLTVTDVKMSHRVKEQLFSCICVSSNLQDLCLKSLHCSDHGHGCCLPALDLQKHHSLEKVKLKGLSVKSVLMPGQETIPLHLTMLTLSKIQMTHSGIVQFCSWLGVSSTLEYLALQHLICSDHGDSCCLPALELQKHHSLEKVILEGLSVESVLLPSQLERHQTSGLHEIPLMTISMKSVNMSPQGWKRCVDSLPHLSHRLYVGLLLCNIDKDFRSYIRSCSNFKVTRDYESYFWFKTIEGE